MHVPARRPLGRSTPHHLRRPVARVLRAVAKLAADGLCAPLERQHRLRRAAQVARARGEEVAIVGAPAPRARARTARSCWIARRGRRKDRSALLRMTRYRARGRRRGRRSSTAPAPRRAHGRGGAAGATARPTMNRLGLTAPRRVGRRGAVLTAVQVEGDAACRPSARPPRAAKGVRSRRVRTSSRAPRHVIGRRGPPCTRRGERATQRDARRRELSDARRRPLAAEHAAHEELVEVDATAIPPRARAERRARAPRRARARQTHAPVACAGERAWAIFGGAQPAAGDRRRSTRHEMRLEEEERGRSQRRCAMPKARRRRRCGRSCREHPPPVGTRAEAASRGGVARSGRSPRATWRRRQPPQRVEAATLDARSRGCGVPAARKTPSVSRGGIPARLAQLAWRRRAASGPAQACCRTRVDRATARRKVRRLADRVVSRSRRRVARTDYVWITSEKPAPTDGAGE